MQVRAASANLVWWAHSPRWTQAITYEVQTIKKSFHVQNPYINKQYGYYLLSI